MTTVYNLCKMLIDRGRTDGLQDKMDVYLAAGQLLVLLRGEPVGGEIDIHLVLEAVGSVLLDEQFAKVVYSCHGILLSQLAVSSSIQSRSSWSASMSRVMSSAEGDSGPDGLVSGAACPVSGL